MKLESTYRGIFFFLGGGGVGNGGDYALECYVWLLATAIKKLTLCMILCSRKKFTVCFAT